VDEGGRERRDPNHDFCLTDVVERVRVTSLDAEPDPHIRRSGRTGPSRPTVYGQNPPSFRVGDVVPPRLSEFSSYTRKMPTSRRQKPCSLAAAAHFSLILHLESIYFLDICSPLSRLLSRIKYLEGGAGDEREIEDER